MPATFDVGDRPTITTTFTDADDVATSPDTVDAHVRTPDGTESELTPTEDSEGVFVTTLPTLDQSGRWWVRVRGTAGLIASDEVAFYVRPTNFETP